MEAYGRKAGILLAAGESRRMGRCKALLPYRETTFLSEVLGGCVLANPLVVVTSPEVLPKVTAIEPRAMTILNQKPEKGQLHSLQLALSWLLRQPLEELDGTAVLLVDNPGHTTERMRLLFEAANRAPKECLAAGFEGKGGHPLYLPRRLWEGVLAYNGPEGLRGFLKQTAESPRIIEMGIAEALRDVDTPEDYNTLGREP